MTIEAILTLNTGLWHEAPKSHALELVNVAFRCHAIPAVKFNLVIKSNILCITDNFVRIRISETEYYMKTVLNARNHECISLLLLLNKSERSCLPEDCCESLSCLIELMLWYRL